MTTNDPTYRVRRALTDPEIGAVVAGITQATTTAGLLGGALRTIFNPLLADLGLSVDDFDAEHQLQPADYAIPATQWTALAEAITRRAGEWGASVQIGVELFNMGPSTYDDPHVPAPAIHIPDRQPQVHLLRVTREAVDVIAACGRHLADLGAYYGWRSDVYREALASWHHCLANLFGMHFGADTRVTVDGRLSLYVSCSGGFVYGVIFHGQPRRCTVTGCTATIGDDGAVDQSRRPAVDDHEHQPSYPLGAPQPGNWSLHS